MRAVVVLSPTVVDAMVRAWKKARLSKDLESLGYPSISVIGRVVDLGPEAVAAARGHVPQSDQPEVSDADRVQNLVQQMPKDTRSVFEAYHLSLIAGEMHRGEPHKHRARLLGMAYSTYKYRVNAGWRFLQEWLQV